MKIFIYWPQLDSRPFYESTSATCHSYLTDFPSALSHVAIKLYVFKKMVFAVSTPTLVMPSARIHVSSFQLYPEIVSMSIQLRAKIVYLVTIVTCTRRWVQQAASHSVTVIIKR